MADWLNTTLVSLSTSRKLASPAPATLFYGMSIVLIRTDQQGFVTNIEPVQINDEDVPHITAAVQYEFAVTLESA
jgi:hypothetical protein